MSTYIGAWVEEFETKFREGRLRWKKMNNLQNIQKRLKIKSAEDEEERRIKKKGDAEKQEVQSKSKRIWKRRNEEAESEEAAEKEESEEKMRT